MKSVVTESRTDKKEDFLFNLQIFSSYFDKQLKELLLLQHDVLEMLQEVVKSNLNGRA